MLLKILFCISCIVLSLPAQTQKSLVIEGTGDSQELLRGLSSIYRDHTGNKVIIPNSIGSGGGIKKVIKGDINFARVARPLKENEKVNGLNYILFAYSPVVFVLNTDKKEKMNINTQDIISIYNNTIKNWDDLSGITSNGKIYIVNREKGDSSRSVLEKNLQGFKNIKNMAGITANYNSEAISFITSHKNTIGYLSMPNTINTKLHILSVDNIFPTIDNVRNNYYKLTTPLAFVFKGKLENNAKAFLNFLKTPSAHDFMLKSGVVPVI